MPFMMTKTRLLPLVSALLICNCAAIEAWAADEKGQKQLELSQAIQRQIQTLNVNQVSKYPIDFNFSTFYGMYAYRELLHWAQAAPPKQRSDLMAITRSGLEAVVRDSGMGIPLTGYKGEGQAAGLLFSRGLPRYTAQPDFSRPATLKWNPASFERQATPDAIGQSLAAKSLFVQTDTSDEGKKLRTILLASALDEFQALLPILELGGDKSASYMPTLLTLENDKWTAINTSSLLYGQMSLIQGLTRLQTLLSLSALESETIGNKRVSEWRKEVRRTLEKVYNTATRLHLDPKTGSFVSSYEHLKGASDRLGSEDAGYTLEVLAELASALQKDDPLRADALKRLSAQTDYVVARLEGKTAAPKSFLVKKDQIFAGMLLRLEDQLAIINGLLAAEQATGKEQYGKTALAIFNAVHPALWSTPAGTFRSAAGQTVTAYDGHVFGLALGTWLRLEKSLPPGEARKHGERLIEVVLKQGGLLQAEGPATGEPKQPEDFVRDDLPPLIDNIVALKREEQAEKIAAAVKLLSDQDEDSVPGCRFGGGHFGAAPVLIIQTSIKTPFDPPPASETPSRSTP